MASAGGERVEFVLPHAVAGGDPDASPDLIEGATDARTGTPRGARWVLLALVVALVGVGMGARELAGPAPLLRVAPPAPDRSAAAGPVVLPVGFGTPRQILSLPAATDLAWVLGSNGALVRVDEGVVVARSAPDSAPLDAVAIAPDGSRIVAASGGSAPAVQILDPVTLHLRGQVRVARPAQTVAAGARFVYTVDLAGVRAFRVATSPTSPTSAVPVPVAGASLPPGIVGTGGALQTGDDTGVREGSDDVLPPTVAVSFVAYGATGGRVLSVTPATGTVSASSWWTGQVSVVAEPPMLIAHDDGRGAVTQTTMDPTVALQSGFVPTPQPAGATIWPATGVGTAYLTVTPGRNVVECFDDHGVRTGRATVGDDGTGVAGPVARAGPVLYVVDGVGRLVRSGLGSC